MSQLPDSSKSLGDCHEAIRRAFPVVSGQFSVACPGHELQLDYTYRSPQLQMALFQQGRELKDGYWTVVDKDKVVTNKDGSKPSHHNVYPSQAADIYIKKDHKIIWPDKDKPEICALYIAMGKLFEAQGLISGATWKHEWKDWDHVQVAYAII